MITLKIKTASHLVKHNNSTERISNGKSTLKFSLLNANATDRERSKQFRSSNRLRRCFSSRKVPSINKLSKLSHRLSAPVKVWKESYNT